MPLLDGRWFDGRDGGDGVRVAIVSEALAGRLWPSGDAVGRRLYRVLADGPPQPLEIVGVVGNVQDGGLNAPAGDAVYVPWQQQSVFTMSIVARARGDDEAALAAVRRAVAASDPVLAANNTASLSALVSQANALPRLQTILLTVFALVAVALLLLGAYGVMMQLVLSREREFALRLVFGARPRALAAGLLGQSARLALSGAAFGTAAVWLAGTWLEPLVFGVAPRSVVVLAVVGGAVLALAAAAALGPAVRVLRADVRRVTLPT
jgi:ABC-type antimicrobial peptide transport system permease subunit